MKKNNKSENKNRKRVILGSLVTIGICLVVGMSFMNNKDVVAETKDNEEVAINEDTSEQSTELDDNLNEDKEVGRLNSSNAEKEENLTQQITEQSTETTTVDVIEVPSETTTVLTTQETTTAPTTQKVTEKSEQKVTEKATEITTKKQTTNAQNKPNSSNSSSTPKDGDVNSAGTHTWMDGFGWVEGVSKGDGSGTVIEEFNFTPTGNIIGQ